LSLLLFLFFCAGAALGVAAVLIMMYRQRRQLASVRKALHANARAQVRGRRPDASLL
jgi:hypothetical protein